LVNKVLDKVNTTTFWQILKPFNVWLWVAIGLTFCIFAATIYLFERRKNEVDFMYSSKLSNAGMWSLPSWCVVG
jgi:multisubunit Na+/H+ antiporter MnhB subunit